MKVRVLLMIALALASPLALAQNVAHGDVLYRTYCIACHGFPPAGGPDTVRGDPQVIRNALNRVAPMMILRNILTDTDIRDIAAYLGSLSNPLPPPPAGPPADASFQGLWLRTPFDSEAGWGLNLTHQGNTLFGTWFTYDTDGTGMWLVMSNGALVSPGRYEGTLYRTTGPGFNATPFTSINASNYTIVGSLILVFHDANSGTMTYTVNGISQSKPIGRYIYATGGTNCTLGGTQAASPNYQDLWWRSPADTESGWGLNITHQGDILFATWFTYEAGGTAAAPAKGMWLVMSNGNRTGPGVYTGTLYRTVGPAFSAVPFTSIGTSNYTVVGSMTVTFTDANNGTFMYTVNGITQTRSITRLVYASPTTVCR